MTFPDRQKASYPAFFFHLLETATLTPQIRDQKRRNVTSFGGKKSWVPEHDTWPDYAVYLIPYHMEDTA